MPGLNDEDWGHLKTCLEKVTFAVLDKLQDQWGMELPAATYQTYDFSGPILVQIEETRPQWWRISEMAGLAMPALGEFGELVEFLRDNGTFHLEFLAQIEGAVVEPQNQAEYLAKFGLMNLFMGGYLRLAGSLSWDQTVFDEVASALRSFLESSHQEVLTVAPVFGLLPGPRIEIDSQLKIDVLTPETKKEMWDRYSSVQYPRLSPEELFECSQTIEQLVRVPKFEVPFDFTGLRFSATVEALRILQPSDFYVPFAFMCPQGPTFRRLSTSFRVMPDRPLVRAKSRPPSAFVDQASHDLPRLVRAIEELHGRAALLAVRRFGLAYDRQLDEDRILDYWIALEGLFLPDGGQELSYRVSLRVASFLGGSPEERVDLFAKTRRSYAIRSKVAHGAESPADLHEVANLTEGLVRRSLRRILLEQQGIDVQSLDGRVAFGYN
jgi:hypothetical protein